MVITQTPLRISFAGGGTDFREFFERHEGHVVSSAIDKYVYVIAQPRIDDLIILHYSKREEVENIEDVQHDMIRACLQRLNMKGIEIHLMADIHLVGSGLGASSSVLVGVLNALYALQGIQASPQELASLACEVEIRDCGRPIGYQDQYIAAYGGICHLVFNAEGVRVHRLPVSKERRREIQDRLLLFSLGYGLEAETTLVEQQQRTEAKELDDILLTLAEYAKEVDDVCMEVEPLSKLGWILRQSWKLKKECASTISNARIDRIYSKATALGAMGGKVCGAGGRGHMIFYVEPELQPAVIRGVLAVEGVKPVPFNLVPHGSRVIFQSN